MAKPRGKFIDLTGQQFGRLTAISRAPNRGRRTMWQCHCSCGQDVIVGSSGLISGPRFTRSCGCLRSDWSKEHHTRHGMYGTPTYSVWRSMMKRCYQVANNSYPPYGGRGVTVCESWHTFTNFHADMGDRPAGRTLDRIDNAGNYEPRNCRWATPKEQSQNSRNPRLLTYNGETMNLTEWAKRIGISPSGIAVRLRAGWPLEKVLSSTRFHRFSR